jgi:hypothetical protein
MEDSAQRTSRDRWYYENANPQQGSWRSEVRDSHMLLKAKRMCRQLLPQVGRRTSVARRFAHDSCFLLSFPRVVCEASPLAIARGVD